LPETALQPKVFDIALMYIAGHSIMQIGRSLFGNAAGTRTARCGDSNAVHGKLILT
jgi:hypothetical protein